MIWYIAWRNIWRNRMRSIIIMVAIIIGIFAGTFAAAMMKGMMDQRIHNVIKTELSHIQIHEKDFLKLKETEKYLQNVNQISKVLDTISDVVAHSERVITSAMVMSADGNAGINLIGINPSKEKLVTNLYDQIIEGSYFDDGKSKRIVIGKKLAEKLNLKIGSRPVFTFQTITGNLTNDTYRVVGIFETVNSTYDETHAFVNINELTPILEMPENSTHEVAVLLNQNNKSDKVKEEIKSVFPDYSVLTWTDLSPEMKVVTKGMEFSMYIFIAIILIALLFSIINTMLMVVLERTKEIGMLMSVGMNRLKVFRMILLESVYLSGFAGIIGVGIGYGIAKIFSVSGIDLSNLYGDGLRNYGYDPVMYPDIDISMVINITIMVFITGILASIIPARRALKLNPAEAVRTDM
ncbi:MAG: ABC transporter permease [Salinivirgaceae bacterium]|nr:MAG: ABC transporter permease [Salinivirgaceae bacterium]